MKGSWGGGVERVEVGGGGVEVWVGRGERRRRGEEGRGWDKIGQWL